MKRILGLCLLPALVSGCATNPSPLRPFDPALHGTAAEEWGPHEKTVEWWYATGTLKDEEGKPYFFQFTLFHGYRLGFIEGFVLHLALTDVRGGKHLFFEDSSSPESRVYGNGTTVAFKDSAISMQVDAGAIIRISLRGSAPGFSFALESMPAKPAVWHGESGVIGLGRGDRPAEESFYYSFTRLDAEGSLSLGATRRKVTGTAWFDRQWGVFDEYGWDWFSLRLNDRRELMLFGFPKNGVAAGTLVKSDGQSAAVPGFAYEKLGSMRYAAADGKTYVLGWRITLPTGEEFRLLPVLADQFNPSTNTPPYWEGLCEVYSGTGENVGWCVTETTADAQ